MRIVGLPLLFIKVRHVSIRNIGRRRENREGEVAVAGRDAAAGEKIIGDHVGEYVDFEEVDDRKK